MAASGSAAASASPGVSRPLMLVFKTKTAGLTFQAYWAEPDGETAREREVARILIRPILAAARCRVNG